MRLRRLSFFLCFAAVFLSALRADGISYGPIRLAELVDLSETIAVVDITVVGEKVDLKVVETLQGPTMKTLVVPAQILTYKTRDGDNRRTVYIGAAGVDVDELKPLMRRVIFLGSNADGRLNSFHPDCLQSEERKARVLEVLAMKRNAARFISGTTYSGDVDLIYTLGNQFSVPRIYAPQLPDLERLADPRNPIPEELPWQRIRLELSFTFDATRMPSLQMAPLRLAGPWPDLIRKAEKSGEIERAARIAGQELPSTFSVVIGAIGPDKVGDTKRSNAAEFLRKQLQGTNVEVVEVAYSSLAKMQDEETVPIAIVMLKHANNKFRRAASKFLAAAKDPRSVVPPCDALDELPRCIRYAFEGYDEGVDQLSGALGRAICNLDNPDTVPALKRAVLKGYAGDCIAMTLSWLGDESAFEPLLEHMRDPHIDHYADPLVTLIQRSNMEGEPWMKLNTWSDNREGKLHRATQWIQWWESHKREFRIVRSAEEAARLESK